MHPIFVDYGSSDAADLLDFALGKGIPPEYATTIATVASDSEFLGRALGSSRDRSQDREFSKAVIEGAATGFARWSPDAAMVDFIQILCGFRDADWWNRILPKERATTWTEAVINPVFHRARWLGPLVGCVHSWAGSLSETWTPTAGRRQLDFVLNVWLCRYLELDDFRILDAIDIDMTMDYMRNVGSGSVPGPSTPMFWLLAFNQVAGRDNNAPPPASDLIRCLLDSCPARPDKDAAVIYLAVFESLVLCEKHPRIDDPLIAGLAAWINPAAAKPLISARSVVLPYLAGLFARAHANGSHALLEVAWLKIGVWLCTRFSRLLASNDDFSRGGAALGRNDSGELYEQARLLLEHADKVLGHARKSIRECVEVNWDVLESSVKILRWLASPSRALRATVQLLIAAPEACVLPDLRWWDEDGMPAAPLPWRLIPEWYSWIVQYIDADRSDDPDFKQAREDLAWYLLGRLKDCPDSEKPADQAGARLPVEPNPAWRATICMAVEALRVNPKGRGDHILYKAMQEDPDPGVREAAARAYKSVRYFDGGTAGVSARVLFMKAFFYLRQGHLIALGQHIDPNGAKSTRDKEYRRITGNPLF